MQRLRDHGLSAFEVTGWCEIYSLPPLRSISTMDSALPTKARPFGNEYRLQDTVDRVIPLLQTAYYM